MSGYPPITLHYFDVRGRGQFIRALLTHREVPYNDERVTLSADLSSWRETRKDRSITGAFQKLPTLQWRPVMIGEVLVILDFLHRKLGDAERLDEEDNLRHAMLASSAFLDLLTPCINLIWCDVFHPGVDMAKATRRLMDRLAMHLATVNQTLDEWRWLDGLEQRPLMAADAVLWEALDFIRLTFAGHLALDRHAALADFYRLCPGRATFESLLKARLLTLTARPGEAEALEIIHSGLPV